MVAESNGSDGLESLSDAQMSEEMLALVDEFENAWPLEAFEGALEVKGRRMDLQGIRVLKKGLQDGVASSSCFGDCGDDDDDETEWVRSSQAGALMSEARSHLGLMVCRVWGFHCGVPPLCLK